MSLEQQIHKSSAITLMCEISEGFTLGLMAVRQAETAKFENRLHTQAFHILHRFTKV